MKRENVFSLWTFILCLIIIGALVTTYYFMANYAYQGVSQHIAPLLPEVQRLPKEAGDGISSLDAFIRQTRPLLIPTIYGLGGIAVFLLWLLIHLAGRSAIKKAAPLPVSAARTKEKVRREPGQEGQQSPSPAIQMLSLLQRQGRFIDFIQEDLGAYSDEQVGAAVRNVHQGCKEALAQHLELQPIMSEEEGAPVTIQPGFDLHSIRLSGKVSGNPPFRGILRHHGWRVVRVDLPKQVGEKEKDWVLAPAEVEV